MSKLREYSLSMALMLTSLAFTFGALELFLRATLFVEALPSLGLREPRRFADPFLEDDFWKLTYRFGTASRSKAVGYVDPQLGWNTRRTQEDPLGIEASEPYTIDDIVDPILFYGDSFVGGRDNIPHELDLLIPDRSVLNFGVGGYGFDQTYLKLTMTAGNFDAPLILVGILTYDLDRSVLGFRSHQKPYFDIEDDALMLRNTPVLKSTDDYLEHNPIRISSYLGRFILFRLRDMIPPDLFDRILGYSQIRKKKRIVNRAILQALHDDAQELGTKLYVVLFYSGKEIDEPTWRESFLKENLNELNIDYFDTRSYLLDYMAATGKSLEAVYRDGLGHLNHEGRYVLARGLAEQIAMMDRRH